MSGPTPIETEVVEVMTAAKLTLATAESCTGGLVAHRITNIPGASRIFRGGVVAYADEIKVGVLGVSPALLAEHGAVSEEAAKAMAEGILARMKTGFGLSLTGIAGPDGGSPEKPVGLVYMALASPHRTEVRKRMFVGDRVQIKHQAAEAALQLLREALG